MSVEELKDFPRLRIRPWCPSANHWQSQSADRMLAALL